MGASACRDSSASGERYVWRRNHQRRVAVALVASTLFAGALAAFALGGAGAGAATSATVHPDADTYVDSSSPSTNYGTRDLRVEGSPTVNSYLRFTVPSTVGTVVNAQLRVYAKSTGLPRVLGGLGTAIISTSSGLLTDRQAAKRGVGGEVLAYVW